MNAKLAAALIKLTEPDKLLTFVKDPRKSIEEMDLTPIDRAALATCDRRVLKYQALYGDLTLEKLRSIDLSSMDPRSEAEVDLAPNHEHDVDHEEGPDEGPDEGDKPNPPDPIKRAFGPHMRVVD